jgi:hypothetical protein
LSEAGGGNFCRRRHKKNSLREEKLLLAGTPTKAKLCEEKILLAGTLTKAKHRSYWLNFSVQLLSEAQGKNLPKAA